MTRRIVRAIETSVGTTALALSIVSSVALAQSQANNLDGRWAATLTQDGVVIPFRLDITGSGSHVTGTLYSGDDRETTTSARIENGSLQLNFEHYLTKIDANVKDGELDGQLVVTRRSPINITPGKYSATASDSISAFHAKRYVPPTEAEAANVPSIDGVWEIPHESPKGEKAWRLIVKQTGPEIEASVLRVDGDTGALTGELSDSHHGEKS